MSYLDTTNQLYKEAAVSPNVGLCCTTSPIWQLPELSIPDKMIAMNYGCGTTVHPRDLTNNPKVLYVGIGGGMELLQFAYFSRFKGQIIGIDVLPEMIATCADNLKLAEKENQWFNADFIDLKLGNALNLPLEDNCVDVAAQNCVFNIFKQEDLKQSLKEMYRVLKPHGRLVMSDPFCDQEMPFHLQEDPRLRAECLSGAIPLKNYLKAITDVGFGTVEVRARRPYRIISPNHYPVKEIFYIESVEICAIKDPVPEDGPCIFTGKTAIYYGKQDYFDDKKGHTLLPNQPLAICDKTALSLKMLGSNDIYLSESTYHYNGGGCC